MPWALEDVATRGRLLVTTIARCWSGSRCARRRRLGVVWVHFGQDRVVDLCPGGRLVVEDVDANGCDESVPLSPDFATVVLASFDEATRRGVDEQGDET